MWPQGADIFCDSFLLAFIYKVLPAHMGASNKTHCAYQIPFLFANQLHLKTLWRKKRDSTTRFHKKSSHVLILKGSKTRGGLGNLAAARKHTVTKGTSMLLWVVLLRATNMRARSSSNTGHLAISTLLLHRSTPLFFSHRRRTPCHYILLFCPITNTTVHDYIGFSAYVERF